MNPYAVSGYLREPVLEPAQAPGDLTWHDGALCAQVGGDLWYPEKGGSVLEAKAVCRRCPVREPCLGYALDRNEAHGVWGGLSHEERERVAARYRRGASLEDIIVAANARQDAGRAAASEHSRQAGLAGAVRVRAARAARRAEQPSIPQPQKEAALCASSSPPAPSPRSCGS